jgi:hypothetical protein
LLFPLNQTFKMKDFVFEFYISPDNASYFAFKNNLSGNFTINSLQKELQNKFNSGYYSLIEKNFKYDIFNKRKH